ncbi:hypothetical protein V2J09_011191 [Rumex salicifolius]
MPFSIRRATSPIETPLDFWPGFPRMNLQQSVQPRTSANGFGRRRVEREMGARIDNKSQSGKINPSRVPGVMSNSRGGSLESPSRDRLVYLSTGLIGLHVKNGSIFSGIFHSTNTDKDFGVVLKMARLIKDASGRGQKAASDNVNRAPSKTQIIPAQELVQIIAKDVPLTKEGLNNELQQEKQELLLDSYISKSRHMEGERQLERWVPDADESQNAELENIFDKPWTGGWDQFKVNETLFGVKSTFNEDLYTTKLEKGPQMRELEEEAVRIAREIEGEDTLDLHLAEERGMYSHANFDVDEETRYSSVFRGLDDSGYAEEDTMIDTRNDDTFGDFPQPGTSRSFADVTSGKIHDVAQPLSSTKSVDDLQSSQLNPTRELPQSGSLADELSSRSVAVENDARLQGNHINESGGNACANDIVRTKVDEDPHTRITQDMQSLKLKEDISVKGVPPAEATKYAVSDSLTKGQEKYSSCSTEVTTAGSGKVHGTFYSKSSRGRPSSSTSPTSEGGGATSALSGPALSPASSMGSLSSEKSTLNPNAKEFKLNPNAKSFVPIQTAPRPASPVGADNPFYFPSNMPAAPSMHGMHVGLGVGPSYPGPQPMMFNPQAAQMQSPQMYFPPNTPQYGQQMLVHPRQVMYMQSYPNEMPYKGREY